MSEAWELQHGLGDAFAKVGQVRRAAIPVSTLDAVIDKLQPLPDGLGQQVVLVLVGVVEELVETPHWLASRRMVTPS